MPKALKKIYQWLLSFFRDEEVGKCPCGGTLRRKYTYLDITYCDKCGKTDEEM